MRDLAKIPTEQLIAELSRRQAELEAALAGQFSTPTYIEALVAHSHGLKPVDLHLETRAHHIAHPRQLAMYLMREAGMTYPNIAAHYRVDHGTIIYACKAVAKRVHTDTAQQSLCKRVSASLKTQRISQTSVHTPDLSH